MSVRLATAADIPAMIDLERQCETAAHWTPGQYLAAMPACGAALTSRLVLVIDEEGKVLPVDRFTRRAALTGFLVARHQGREWELENMVVAAASRRKGLGKRLLGELLSRAQGAGSECVLLEVRESNRAARAFYEKHRFEETGRRPAYYSSPPEDAIVYQRKLSGSK